MLNNIFDFKKTVERCWEQQRLNVKAVFIWKLGRDSINLYLPLSWVLASILAENNF